MYIRPISQHLILFRQGLGKYRRENKFIEACQKQITLLQWFNQFLADFLTYFARV